MSIHNPSVLLRRLLIEYCRSPRRRIDILYVRKRRMRMRMLIQIYKLCFSMLRSLIAPSGFFVDTCDKEEFDLFPILVQYLRWVIKNTLCFFLYSIFDKCPRNVYITLPYGWGEILRSYLSMQRVWFVGTDCDYANINGLWIMLLLIHAVCVWETPNIETQLLGTGWVLTEIDSGLFMV